MHCQRWAPLCFIDSVMFLSRKMWRPLRPPSQYMGLVLCGQGGTSRLQVGSQEVRFYVLRLKGRANFPTHSPFPQPAPLWTKLTVEWISLTLSQGCSRVQGTGDYYANTVISLLRGLMTLPHVSATRCGSVPALAQSQQEKGVDH